MTYIRKSQLGFAILAIVFAAGCNTVTQPQQYSPGSFTADLTDGSGVTTYFTSTNAHVVQNATDYSVYSTENSYELDVFGIPISSALPYTTTTTDNQNLDVRYHDAANNRDYEANFAGGSVTVTITQTSPTLQGSFRGKLVCQGVQDTVRNLTNGVFNASY